MLYRKTLREAMKVVLTFTYRVLLLIQGDSFVAGNEVLLICTKKVMIAISTEKLELSR